MKVLLLVALLAVGAFGRGIRSIPDPYNLPNVNYVFTGENGVTGSVNLDGLQVTGGSQISHVLEVDIEQAQNIHFNLDVPHIRLGGNIDAQIGVSTVDPAVDFSAGGAFFVQQDNFNYDMNVGLNIHNNDFEGDFEVSSVELAIRFGQFTADIENSLFNDEQIPWAEVSQTVTREVTRLLEEHEDTIEEYIKFGANYVFQNCSIHDLLQGNFSCATIPEFPSVEDIIHAIVVYSYEN